MTKKLELYRCNTCGNIVEILNDGSGELVCCEKPMELIKESESDNQETNDKHVPIISKTIEGFEIRIGSKEHPMTHEHHIIFIQGISKDKQFVKTKFLRENETPELNLKCSCSDVWARALCNIHGLFKGEYNA